MIVRTAFIIGLLAAGAAHGQTAQPGPMTPEQRFKAADVNGDGKVDKAEFLATLISDAKPYVEAIFASRDTNRDGWLTQDELTTNGPSPAGRGLPGAPPSPLALPR